MRICTYKDCTNKHSAKGLCKQHYNVLIKKVQSLEWYRNNKDKKAEQSAKWFEQNKERWKEYNAKLYLENKERYAKNGRKWRSNNPGKARAHSANYRASKLKATPRWANLAAISDIYDNCPKDYEVDHIVPLQGKEVCGLHVEYNLQYLPMSENRRKSNNIREGLIK